MNCILTAHFAFHRNSFVHLSGCVDLRLGKNSIMVNTTAIDTADLSFYSLPSYVKRIVQTKDAHHSFDCQRLNACLI